MRCQGWRSEAICTGYSNFHSIICRQNTAIAPKKKKSKIKTPDLCYLVHFIELKAVREALEKKENK